MGAHTAVAELDDLLVQLTSTVAVLFGEIDSFLDRLDLAAVTRAVEDALNQIRDLITQQVGALFEPVRGALAAAVDTLSSAATAFDAAAIVDALRELLQELTGVLDDPQVRGPIEAARQALDQAAAALRSLSLRPVTDTVIADIEKVTKTLEKVDPESLPDPVRGALKAAVSVSPSDFTPITRTFTGRFDDLVESGPKPLLTAIRDQPQALVDAHPGLLASQRGRRPAFRALPGPRRRTGRVQTQRPARAGASGARRSCRLGSRSFRLVPCCSPWTSCTPA